MEDPIRNNCLEPQSLIMTRSECFYCFGPEGERTHTIIHCFGIKSCNVHYPMSIRDCNAYLHREHMVSLYDAVKMPIFKNFFDIIKNGFVVKRSNGIIETGWSIMIDNNQCEQYHHIIRKNADNWIIPVYKKKEDLIKRIALSELLIPENLKILPDNFEKEYNIFVSEIDKGIYREDSLQYDNFINRDNETTVKDIPEIKLVSIHNVPVRILDVNFGT
jgi:hypothetical protein